MKKLLVPCDFSPCSKEALKIAADFAQLTDSEVLVIYGLYMPSIFEPSIPEEDPGGYYEEFVNGVERDALKQFRQLQLEAKIPDVRISFKVIHDDVVNAILTEAEIQKVDFIFMGATGNSGIQEVFLGSTTEKVVRYANVPVCVVRRSTKLGNIRNILFPTELTLNQRESISKVKDLQNLFNATLHLLLVNTPFRFITDNDAKIRFHDFIEHYQFKNFVTHFVSDESEEAGIINFATSNHMDLVVMGTHARKGLSRLFVRSITNDVVRKIECPIVTYGLIESDLQETT